MIPQERLRVELPVVLSLGSNLGDREATIRDAVSAIAGLQGVRAIAASGLVQTPALKPYGVEEDAPAYLNAILRIRTSLSPEQLLEATSAIEQGAGRTRNVRWGDRTLDIDIISWGPLTIDTERLTIPHPRAATRVFVLAPWLEVQPDATLAGESVAELLAATGDTALPYPAEPLL